MFTCDAEINETHVLNVKDKWQENNIKSDDTHIVLSLTS
jgi:hypothetical protein